VITRLGAYEILRELKSGGMGAVLLGRRRGPGSFEQLVALKTIRAELAGAAAVRAMFLDEAAILARIGHPGIAAVHDFGEEGGALYLAMEYVAGIPFRALADLDVPPAIAARAIAEACRGLQAAHEVRDPAGHVMGVVHRDISPDNLMLGFDGHVKVIDFGIALVRNRQAPVTELGTLKGKPPYMSPEQVKNEAIDRRSDVFSLAVVLHELLAGRPLFQGDSIYAVARAVEHQPIPPPSRVRGQALPPGLDDVVLGALERDLALRTPTAAALAEELEQVIQAAGGETLEAWAERALAGPREAHRRWLAEVAAGRAAPRPVGRATGAVTQLPPEQAAALGEIAPPVMPRAREALPREAPPREASPLPPPTTTPTPTPAGQGVTMLGPAAADAATDAAAADAATDAAAAAAARSAAPRRRPGARLLLALLLLVGAVGGLLLLLPARRGAPGPAPDAAVTDAGPVRTAVAPTDAARAPEDAPAPAEDAPAPPADATAIAPPISAPPGTGTRRPRPRVDAGIATGIATAPAGVPPPPPRDAAVPATAPEPPVPTGAGRISIVGRGEAFLNILVDGRPFQVTPQLQKPIAAGKHAIVLLDPKTNQVVFETTVTIEPGQHVRVQPP